MHCKAVRSRLSEYLDGRVSPLERARIEVHLGTCTPCARLWVDHASIQALLRAESTAPEVPPRLWEGVRARIEALAAPPWWLVLARGFARLRWVAVPALTVAMVAAGLVVPWWPGHLPPAAPAARAPEVRANAVAVARSLPVQAPAVPDARFLGPAGEAVEAALARASEPDDTGRLRWQALRSALDECWRDIMIETVDTTVGLESVRGG